MEAKDLVLASLLARQRQFQSFKTIRMGTLGGVGMEVEQACRLGVLPDNIFLVERNSKRAGALARRYPGCHVMTCAIGKKMARAFSARQGKDAALDYFHLDLCGAFESVALDAAHILPLLANGRGRGLAITVADQRAHRIDDERSLTKRLIKHLFGPRWMELWQHSHALFTELHHVRASEAGRSGQSVWREMSTLSYFLLMLSAVEPRAQELVVRQRGIALSRFNRIRAGNLSGRTLSPLLRETQTWVVPEVVERTVYWSGPNSFRMRTYWFRLQFLSQPISIQTAAAQLVDCISRGRNLVMKDGSLEQVRTTHNQVQGGTMPTSTVPSLSEVKKEVDALLANPAVADSTKAVLRALLYHVDAPRPLPDAVVSGLRAARGHFDLGLRQLNALSEGTSPAAAPVVESHPAEPASAEASVPAEAVQRKRRKSKRALFARTVSDSDPIAKDEPMTVRHDHNDERTLCLDGWRSKLLFSAAEAKARDLGEDESNKLRDRILAEALKDLRARGFSPPKNEEYQRRSLLGMTFGEKYKYGLLARLYLRPQKGSERRAQLERMAQAENLAPELLLKKLKKTGVWKTAPLSHRPTKAD